MEDRSSKVEPAIIVRGVSKQYIADQKILDYLDMTVIKGTIYGLLGASGCGKTTLLSAIVGTRKVDNGLISILGKAPGVVPIKSIGYMPQDIALIGELSIKNVIQQQGWIFGMTSKEIEERHKFYEKLLDLPPGNRLIKNLSGGQQRRVSLAVVLIQDPELLILDEPTVGLDPVLRKNLWDYFTKITKEEKKTVIVTTHYIEEAKQADMVGMLRHGKMLAEGEPQILMDQFNCSSLEKLFITLSTKQEERDLNVINAQHQNRLIPRFDELKILNQPTPKESLLKKICFINSGHAKALLSKNFIRYLNDPATLVIMIFMPIIQITILSTAIGRIPEDMALGIVNQELGEYKNCEDYLNDNQNIGGSPIDENGTCVYNGLGCKFIKHLQNVIHNQIYYESVEEAMKNVKKGKVHQVLFFAQNYSESVTEVNEFVRGAFDENLETRDIVVYRDEADYTLGLHIEKEIYKSYEKFAQELATDCKWGKNFGKLPMTFNDPIYGRTDLTYSDYVTPGIMTLVVLLLPKALAVHTILGERTGGVWERMLVSGVTVTEILICHIITMGSSSAIQTMEIFFMSYYVFGFECKGSIFYVLLLIYLQAFIGITIGLLLSVVSKSETTALYGALGISFPFFLITGFFWPLEGIPPYLRYVSYAMPPTIPIESLSNIIFRGWDITNFHVYKGYLTSIAFSCFFTIVSALLLKFEKK